MANELSIHSDDLGAYRTMTARVSDHRLESSGSFTTLSLRLDDMRVSVYLHPGDLLDFAGALARAAVELRAVAAGYAPHERINS